MKLIITNHASDRLKERVGLKSQREKETYVLKAYREGLCENDCSGISLKLIQNCKKWNTVTEIWCFIEIRFLFFTRIAL